MRKTRFYETYQEAKKAIEKVFDSRGIAAAERTYTRYYEYYKDDPKLTSTPYRLYAGKGWVDWPSFLGKLDYYATYEEAQKAIAKVFDSRGIAAAERTYTRYYKYYKDDPKLTSTPYRRYAGKGWVDWPSFLGKLDYYATYEEVQNATKKLFEAQGIVGKDRTVTQYKRYYKNDPKLSPNVTVHQR